MKTTLIAVAALLALATMAPARAGSDWPLRLQQRLADLDATTAGEVGVYVRDLDSGERVGRLADESWYLASGIKVLVAIAVLRAVDAGECSLDEPLVLQADDYVDGAGTTNRHPPGSALAVDGLLQQMIIASDNTATDVLIRRIGLARVNAVAAELLPGFDRITTLADVRRHAYSQFHPAAFGLSSADLLELRRHGGAARIARLAELLQVPADAFPLASLDAAFDAYYATGLNTATLAAYGDMLAALRAGQALGADSTAYLLALMSRIETGRQRLQQGLPAGTHFAHKTGTQHRRACDFGIVEHAGRRLAVAACVRGAPRLADSERALREVAGAITASGVFEQGGTAAPSTVVAP